MPKIWRDGLSIVFIASIVCLSVSPFFMPIDYSWIANTTSESAAQGLRNAWIARLGFVTFGLAVIWQSAYLKSGWSISVRCFHSIFGISMLFVAVFSKKHWNDSIVFDPIEDMLHSVFATVMGFAFSFGVLFSFFKKGRDPWRKLLDVAAISISIVIPILMLYFRNIDGLIQRLMFGVSYFWYLRELMTTKRI